MTYKFKILTCCCLFITVGAAICSCNSTKGMVHSKKSYAFIFKNENNLYGKREMQGFENAILENGGTCVLKAPDTVTAKGQQEIIEELMDQNVDAIAIAANDSDELKQDLQAAMQAGIQVLSSDSAVNKDSRILHINQADSEDVGSYLVKTAYEIAGGSGQIAIVSTTPQADNQNTWISYMKKTLAEKPYRKLKLQTIVYGEDEFEASRQITKELLASYPELEVIIAPTAAGLPGVALGIEESGRSSTVKVTGLGLPSEMAEYMKKGTCPSMYLWNPVDIGYLTGYAAVALAKGEITGKVGETLTANRLGEFTITEAEDGGTEIVLGEPFLFDADNIDEWKEVY